MSSGAACAARLDNYRTLLIRRDSTLVKRTARLRMDKGYRAEWQSFVAHVTGKAPVPIALSDIVLSTRTALAAQRSLSSGQAIRL